jgi:hypothetical protein
MKQKEPQLRQELRLFLFHSTVELKVRAKVVLELLYTESTMTSGFFLKKEPPCTQLNRAHELENCSKARTLHARSAAAPPQVVTFL